MATTKAKIGRNYVSAIGPISWLETTGTAPYTTVIEVHQSEADGILKYQGKPVPISVDGEGGFSELMAFVIGRAPSSAPYYTGIVFADVRWLWQRVHVMRRFNVPRRTGTKRLVSGSLVELTQITDNLTYASWSLNKGHKWKAQDMLRNVLTRVTSLGGGGFDMSKCPKRDLPIENLELDDPGDSALARALAFVPGAEIRVRDGRVFVFDTQDLKGTEKAIEKIYPPIVGGGVFAKVEQEKIRPSAIEVLFNREVEIRADAKSEGTGSDETVAPDSQTDLSMVNVLPSPDFDIVVGGKHVYRGTWMPVEDMLAAWSRHLPAGVSQSITIADVRKNWFYGLWNVWSEMGKRDPDADWVARLSALRQHFRQTYRVNPNLMRRLRSIRSTRVAVVDEQTGTRAPALVESDYCVQMGEKGRWAADAKGQEFFLWQNVNGYPSSGKIADGKPAPALMRVLDEQLGILRFDYIVDPTRRADAVHPSRVCNEAGLFGTPTHDLRYEGLQAFGPTDDGKVVGTNAALQLSLTHRVLTVFTAAPGAPNNENQLHTISVKPKDLEGLIPAHAANGDGPVWQVRVSPALWTARFAWMDEFQNTYPKLLGLNTDDPDAAGLTPEQVPAEVWQNETECRGLAKAVAAAIYSKLADHYQGQQTIHVKDDLAMTGNMASALHTLDTTGLISSTFRLAPEVKAMDLFAFLPSGLRSIILQLVQFHGPS